MSRRLLAAGCAPQLLVALDFAYIGVVGPSLRTSLELSDHGLQWVVGAYSLSFGCLLLPCGRAADVFGRRRMLLMGLALFGCATGVNAAAPTGAVLLASRAVQGAGAAMMTPAALSLLTTGSAPGCEQERAVAAYGMAISAGFVAGSLVAGALATAASWRPVLALNLPVVLAALLVTRAVHERECGRRNGGSRPRLWRTPALLSACLCGLVITGTGVTGVLLLTLYLQDVRGHTPLAAGFVLALFGVSAPAGGAVARRAAHGWGPVTALAIGVGVQGVSLLALVLAPADGAIFSVLAAVAGFGLGHVVGNAAAALTAVAPVPPAMHGTVAGVLATAQYVGGAVIPAAIVGVAGFRLGVSLAGGLCLAAAGALVLLRPRCRVPST